MVHLPWRDVEAAPGGRAVSTSVLPGEAALLAGLAAGRTVLEVGSAYGYSAAVMALAGAAEVIAVDNGAVAPREVLAANLRSYGVRARVKILPGDSRDRLPVLAELGYQFGLIFIDGDHTAAGVDNDLGWAAELSEPGGMIAVHDYGEDCCCPDVRQVCDARYPAGPDQLTGTLFVVKT